jgi:triosephosphate isomerase (TIM)
MRKKITAGNWKMNLSYSEAEQLVAGIAEVAQDENDEIVVFSPSIYLKTLLDEFGASVKIGAQNGYPQDQGAFTGEVSILQLKQIGVKHLLIGHSERRDLFHETNALLKEKVTKALELGFTIYFCCGEQLSQRELNQHFSVIEQQLNESLFHIEKHQFAQVVIAYEPVWAIGTGKTASSAQAEEMHQFIRSQISRRYDENIAQNTSILYGGSCNPTNAAELFTQTNIDGGLIGGASLSLTDFIAIAEVQKIA